jgi:hypothetical protein
VPGLGQYSGIFDFVFQDHYLSLRQWHGPVQPDSVDSATVPFDVSLEDSVAKPSPNSSSSSIGCSSSNGNSSNSGGDLGCSCTAASITGVVADISRGDISGNRMCRCVRVRCSSTCVVYVVRGLNLSKLDALLRKQVNIHHKVRQNRIDSVLIHMDLCLFATLHRYMRSILLLKKLIVFLCI